MEYSMVEFRAREYSDSEYDSCGSMTRAVLCIDTIRIPLCQDCIDELSNNIQVFNDTIFCHKCHYFEMNKYGLSYDGSCRKEADRDGTVLTESLVGYVHPRGCMDTCSEAVLRKGDCCGK